MKLDDGWEALREYDDSGYFAKFEIKKMDAPLPSSKHPYRYSFTLHAPSGKRVLGFDNAHATSIKKGKRTVRSEQPDHWHRDAGDKGRPYKYVSLQELLNDFLQEVERVHSELSLSSGIQQIRSSK